MAQHRDSPYVQTGSKRQPLKDSHTISFDWGEPRHGFLRCATQLSPESPRHTNEAMGVTATALVIGAFLVLPLAILALAVIDNKRKHGVWLSRDRKSGSSMDAPLPFERLSAADRDAWFGGGGGT
jgi:hypothetical protein